MFAVCIVQAYAPYPVKHKKCNMLCRGYMQLSICYLLPPDIFEFPSVTNVEMSIGLRQASESHCDTQRLRAMKTQDTRTKISIGQHVEWLRIVLL